MANDLFFSRDTRAFVVKGTAIWEIAILNGFAFTQGTNTSEVTLAEMTNAAGDSRRGRMVFTDSQAPAEWSFDSYIRPTVAATKHVAVEEALWANFVANNTYDNATKAWMADTINSVADTSLDIKFTHSNKSELGTVDLMFVLGGGSSNLKFTTEEAPGSGADPLTSYGVKIARINAATINEVGVNFDIDGIATLNWSGNGTSLRDFDGEFDATAAIRTGIDATNNFIRNRLTQLEIVRTLPAGGTKTYNITLTGGSITLNNNISYLTPELLGRVNIPLGHVSGTRTVGGSFTCYLDATALGSADLFTDLAEATNEVRNVFDLTFYVGGKGTGANNARAPGMAIKMPRCHMTVPAHDPADVIALSVDFSALPSGMSTPDEVELIRYIGV